MVVEKQNKNENKKEPWNIGGNNNKFTGRAL
jgi:hypothetical protein